MGIGKPEPLKGGVAVPADSGEHQLVYRVAGEAGGDLRAEIAGCRYHYG